MISMFSGQGVKNKFYWRFYNMWQWCGGWWLH